MKQRKVWTRRQMQDNGLEVVRESWGGEESPLTLGLNPKK